MLKATTVGGSLRDIQDMLGHASLMSLGQIWLRGFFVPNVDSGAAIDLTAERCSFLSTTIMT